MKKKTNSIKHISSVRGKHLQEKNIPKRFTKINLILLKYTFRISVFIHVILFVITYRLYTPYFQVNDDAAMMLLSSGTTLSIEPTEYLLFTNILMGSILKALYHVSENISWYSLYLVMSLLIAHSAIFYVILKKNPKLIFVFLYLLYFILCSGFLLTSLQFTMIASIVAVAGIVLLFIRPLNVEKVHAGYGMKTMLDYQIVCGMALLFLSSLIRFEAMIQMIAVSLPLWLMDIIYKDARTRILKCIPLFVITLLLCYSAYYYNDYRYQNWGNYNEFNDLRAQFVDNRVVEKAAPEARAAALKKAGWSETDYYMMREWFFMNDTIYNVEKFKLALSELPHSEQKITFSEVLDYQTQMFGSNSVVLLSCVIVCLFLLFFLNFTFKEFFKMASSFVLAYLLLLFINYYLKPPPLRVIYPMFAYLGILPLLMAENTGSINLKRTSWIRIAIIIILAVSIFWAFKSVRTMQSNNSKNIKPLNKEIKNIVNTINPSKDELFVVWGNGFPYEFIAPFEDISFMKDFVFLGLGTTQLTPTSKEILDRYNVKDIYVDLATRKNIHLIVGANAYQGGYIDLFNNYMKEHYHKAIRTTPAFQFEAFVVLDVEFY